MDTCNMKFFDLFTDETVTANGYAYSQPVPLIDTTDDGSRYSIYFSYITTGSGDGAEITLSYETSYFKDNGYFTLTTIEAGTVASGSFTVQDASNAAEAVISGSSHGISTGQYIQLGEMGNAIGWGREKGKIYRVTADDVNSLTLQGKDTSSGFGTYETATSGTAYVAFVHYENLDPTWDTPWIRFKATETAGSSAGVLNAKLMVQ